MTNVPHQLHAEFPEFAEKMDVLRQSDAHFARLYDEYHDINKEVALAEANVKPTDQFHEEELRKKRAHLKDELYRMLNA